MQLGGVLSGDFEDFVDRVVEDGAEVWTCFSGHQSAEGGPPSIPGVFNIPDLRHAAPRSTHTHAHTPSLVLNQFRSSYSPLVHTQNCCFKESWQRLRLNNGICMFVCVYLERLVHHESSRMK